MAIGNGHSPIVDAIRVSQEGTRSEIRVYLSRKWWERDALSRARKLFFRYDLDRAPGGSVLIYANLRKRRFAIVGGEAIDSVVTRIYWDRLARELAVELRATNPERAIAWAVEKIGEELKRRFPRV